MIAEYKKNANIWLLIGFVIWFFGNMMRSGGVGDSYIMLGNLVFVVGAGLFIYGCTLYAKAKGYNWAVGLLGILSLIGLIVLAVLPDKNKNQ